MIAGVYCLITGDIYMFSYMYYLAWLMVMAYIDHRTGYVYDSMEYAIIFPVVLSILSSFRMYENAEYAISYIAAVLIFYAIVKIMTRTGCMGEGDCDILVFNALIMTAGVLKDMYEAGISESAVMKCIMANMAFMMLALTLFTIRNIRYLIFKKMRLKEKKPFLPSVYMSSILFFFIKIGFTFGTI